MKIQQQICFYPITKWISVQRLVFLGCSSRWWYERDEQPTIKRENTNLGKWNKVQKNYFIHFSPFVCLSSCVCICIGVEYVVMSVFDGVVRENFLYQYHFNTLLKKMKMTTTTITTTIDSSSS